MIPRPPILSLLCAALGWTRVSAFTRTDPALLANAVAAVVRPEANISGGSRHLALAALEEIRARYGISQAAQAQQRDGAEQPDALARQVGRVVPHKRGAGGSEAPSSLLAVGEQELTSAQAAVPSAAANTDTDADLPWADIVHAVTNLGVDPKVVKGIADEVADVAGKDSDLGRAAQSISEATEPSSEPKNASDAPALVAAPDSKGNTSGASNSPWSNILDAVAHIGGAASEVGKAVGSVADIVSHVAGQDSDLGKTMHQVADVSKSVSHVSDAVDGVARAGSGKGKETDNPFFKGLDDVSHVMDHIASVAGTVDSAVKTVTSMTDGADKARNLEGSSSREHINAVLFGVLGSLVAVGGVGHLLDRAFPAWVSAGRPRLSLLSVLVASYALLVVGIFSVLFSFNLSVSFLGIHLNLTKDHDTQKPACLTESMISVIKLLFDTGSHVGALLVILYAMIIPTVKLGLLLLSEVWRHSEDKRRVEHSRRCISIVQFVSKWACPDMFAYILMLYLLRHLDGKGGFLEAPAQLDIGFVCFSIFCISSTVTSLAIHEPGKARSEDAGGPLGQEPVIVRVCGREGVIFVAGTCLLVFGALLTIGALTPCMGMRLNSDLLLEPAGPLPLRMKPLVDSLHFEKLVNADVNLWVCVQALWGWLCSKGEAACIIAVIMIVGFVLLLTILDMIVLCVAAFQLSWGEKGGAEQARSSMQVAYVLKHLSMLDVFAMGIVVICAAGGAYRSQGVEFQMMPGLAVLAFAEAVHYATYHLVSGAVNAAAPQVEQAKVLE